MPVRIKRLTGADVSPDGSASRYNFDNNLCHFKQGWAQLDTSEDAAWYGNWVNPTRRMLCEFAEGDVTIWHCDTDADFVRTLQRRQRELTRSGKWRGIDAMCQNDIIARFTELGLGELLH